MAASGLQFNRHRQVAETLTVLTSDYTTDTVNSNAERRAYEK